ncbi:MAG TPA: zf-HC2 domain-containing protein [Candidatus Acidoferrales bacterium]|nr:zf-HC2 domain-containing protein [Candidatus Acidoferrales bacterium]
MHRHDEHLKDAELVLAVDGELSSRRANEVRAHLAECELCRTRMDQIERATAAVARAYRDALDPSLPPVESSRTAFQSRLAGATSDMQQARWFRNFAAVFQAPAWAYVATVLALGALWVALRYQPIQSSGVRQIASEYGAGPEVPNANLTPGVVGAVTVSQICASDEPPERRPPPSMQQAVFHEYGMDGAPAQEYEVDHLITPALGGTDDIRNLWPESYRPEWNAHVKDELEDRLHDLVCQGKLDLGMAQRDMATNWISAYKKYFHTDKPLLRNSSLVADRKRSPSS